MTHMSWYNLPHLRPQYLSRLHPLTNQFPHHLGRVSFGRVKNASFHREQTDVQQVASVPLKHALQLILLPRIKENTRY